MLSWPPPCPSMRIYNLPPLRPPSSSSSFPPDTVLSHSFTYACHKQENPRKEHPQTHTSSSTMDFLKKAAGELQGAQGGQQQQGGAAQQQAGGAAAGGAQKQDYGDKGTSFLHR